MRLTFSLFGLLVVASTSVSLFWRNLGAVEDGATAAVVVLVSGMTVLVSIGLLARIVVKTSAVRQRVKGKSRAG